MKVNFMRESDGNVSGEVRFHPETELDEKVLEQIKRKRYCFHHAIGEYMSVKLKSVDENSTYRP